MVEVRFGDEFQKQLKMLAKRYRKIKDDIQPIIDELQQGNFIGDRIKGTSIAAFKVRAKNSDIPTGKSGGYRLIYRVKTPESVFLLTMYAKSDRQDISIGEIETIAKNPFRE